MGHSLTSCWLQCVQRDHYSQGDQTNSEDEVYGNQVSKLNVFLIQSLKSAISLAFFRKISFVEEKKLAQISVDIKSDKILFEHPVF